MITEKQKTIIKSLNMAGHSYTEIAERLGIEKYQVRWFVRRYRQDWLNDPLDATIETVQPHSYKDCIIKLEKVGGCKFWYYYIYREGEFASPMPFLSLESAKQYVDTIQPKVVYTEIEYPTYQSKMNEDYSVEDYEPTLSIMKRLQKTK